MKWRQCWPGSVITLLVIVLVGSGRTRVTSASLAFREASWTTRRKLAFREKTRELWYHGFDNYMTYAFPLDELSPLSCTGRGPDWANPHNVASNDVAGNFSLTLIDVLDTLVVLNDPQGFEKAVRNIIDWVSFDVNTKPQVFETTIRVLGGLLSGHIFANQTRQPFHLPWYRGELLDMAHDLGQRLLPAFATPTGLPYARINLRHGVVKGETIETCTAGAGSLILEFATLSRLTGDDRFEKAAYKAFFAIWNQKSDIGLVGNTINTWTGAWIFPEVAGIGAGIDSFYEYALKWYVLSGEVEFLDVWNDAYLSIVKYARAVDGFWYRNVNIRSGDVAYHNIDSLSAFWPGLQVLAGDVQNAIRLHMIYWNLWRKHSGLPEVWDVNIKEATSFQYPLRPEFIESTWYLYRATADPFYLSIGERVLHDLIARAKVDCGLTSIQDLRTNKREDRMESFALSETLKYLFLLFDEDNPLHRDDSNYVFTTEGHILTLGKAHLKPVSPTRRETHGVEAYQCPIYQPLITACGNSNSTTGLVRGIRSRGDVDYARELVALLPEDEDKEAWSPNGWCEMPKVELISYEFILSVSGRIVPEDVNPSLHKLSVISDGFVLQNVTGIRTHILQRLDGRGYDIVKLGPHSVRAGQTVYVNDSSLFLMPVYDSQDAKHIRRDPYVLLRFFTDTMDPMFHPPRRTPETSTETEALVIAYTSFFGGDLSPNSRFDKRPLRFEREAGIPIFRDENNPLGCSPHIGPFNDAVILIHRGKCTFLEKLVRARSANAAGILVINDEDFVVNPTAEEKELAAAGDLTDVVIVVLPRKAGELVTRMMDSAEEQGTGQVMLVLDPERRSVTDESKVSEGKQEKVKDDKRILYLNGHPLLNTKLLI